MRGSSVVPTLWLGRYEMVSIHVAALRAFFEGDEEGTLGGGNGDGMGWVVGNGGNLEDGVP